MSENSYFP